MGLLLLNLVASVSHSISLAGFLNKQEITVQMYFFGLPNIMH